MNYIFVGEMPSAQLLQFAPFAALSGYDAAISEAERLTESKIDINEGDVTDINHKMAILMEHVSDHPTIEVTYFMPDPHKDGGADLTHRVPIKKYDGYEHQLVFTDGAAIPVTTILDLEASCL